MRRPISTLSIALSSSLLYLLTVTWHAYTCGPSEDYEKYRISYVDPDLLSDTVYRSYYRMFLQQHQEARWDNSEERDAWYSPDKRGGNLDLWSDYFDGTVPARSISDVVYHLDIAATQRAIALYDKGELADVDRVITPATDEWSQPDTLDVGSFYREVARRKDRAVLAYLLYAKKAADHAWQIDPNGWGDRKEKDIRPMTRLISEGVEALEATASPDLRRRYGFQLVRLARYSGNYDEAADYFRNYVESDPRRDALYFMALAHHAGARRLDGDLDASNELFARIFDSTEERRAESLRDIKISTPGSWERLYARASNDRERVSHLLVRGMKSRSLTFDYLEEIYAIDPRTPKLPFALMRELHRVESFLYDDRVTRDLAVQKKGTITTYNYSSDGVDSAQTNVLPNGNPVRDRHLGKGSSWDSLFFYTPDPEHHYDRDRRRLDGILSGDEYVAAFRRFILKVADEATVPDPAIWYMVAGYLDIMRDDLPAADRNLDRAIAVAVAGGNGDLQSQIHLLRYLRDRLSEERKDLQNVSSALAWLEEKQKINKHTKYDRTLAELGRQYLREGDVPRAILAFDRAKDLVSRNTLVDFYASDDDLHDLATMLATPVYDPVDRTLRSSFPFDVDAINDMRATKMMRQGKYVEARDLYREISAGYWADGNEAAESTCFRFTTNPVVVDTNLPNGIAQGTDATEIHVTRKEFAEALVERLEATKRTRGAATAEFLMNAADLLYNTPFWGYSSTLWDGNLLWIYSFYYKGPTGYPFNMPGVAERMQRGHDAFLENYGARRRSREIYKQVTAMSVAPELSARAAYMLDLCDKQPNASIHRKRPSIAEQPREGYYLLKEKFAGTETGKSVLSRCSVYRLNSW